MEENKNMDRTKRHNFTIVPNEIIKNETLSWKSKSILIYLLSLPDSWSINIANITNMATDGKDGVKAGIKELEKAGYIYKESKRGEKGKFSGIIYNIYEFPEDNPFFTESGLTADGLTADGKSTTINKDSTNTESRKKEREKDSHFSSSEKVEY